MKQSIIPIIVAAVIAAGVGFYGGMRYGQTKTPSFAQQGFANRDGNRQIAGRAGGGNGVVRGQILNLDASTLTVKLADGSSKIVILPDTVTVEKTSQAAKSDIQTGDQVMVIGTANTDGTITAQNIQLNPVMGFGQGPRGTSGQPPTQ